MAENTNQRTPLNKVIFYSVSSGHKSTAVEYHPPEIDKAIVWERRPTSESVKIIPGFIDDTVEGEHVFEYLMEGERLISDRMGALGYLPVILTDMIAREAALLAIRLEQDPLADITQYGYTTHYWHPKCMIDPDIEIQEPSGLGKHYMSVWEVVRLDHRFYEVGFISEAAFHEGLIEDIITYREFFQEERPDELEELMAAANSDALSALDQIVAAYNSLDVTIKALRETYETYSSKCLDIIMNWSISE